MYENARAGVCAWLIACPGLLILSHLFVQPAALLMSWQRASALLQLYNTFQSNLRVWELKA